MPKKRKEAKYEKNNVRQSGRPFTRNPILERYMELAMPYNLFINMEDFTNSATVGLKIEDNGRRYGTYTEIKSLQNNLEIEKGNPTFKKPY